MRSGYRAPSPALLPAGTAGPGHSKGLGLSWPGQYGSSTLTTAAKRFPVVILLVEDDPGDQILAREALKTLHIEQDLRVVSDGEQALQYLYRTGGYASSSKAPRPDLILLDLNMPRVNGQTVAEKIHADPNLRTIPVVVLTTSHRQEDVVRAYGQGVTSYIGKPLDFKDLVTAVQDLESLMKFVLAVKGLGGRTRVTDRQVCRLARRMQQLKRHTDTLFDHYMEQIEKMIQPEDEITNPPGPQPRASPEAARQQLPVRIIKQILMERQASDAGRAGASAKRSSGAGAREETAWAESHHSPDGLLALARHLQVSGAGVDGSGQAAEQALVAANKKQRIG